MVTLAREPLEEKMVALNEDGVRGRLIAALEAKSHRGRLDDRTIHIIAVSMFLSEKKVREIELRLMVKESMCRR